MAIFTSLTTYLTGAIGSAALSSAIVQTGAGLLLNVVSAKLRGQPKVPRQTIQATINQAAGPRVRGYGLVKLGGTRALFEVQDDVLHQIIVAHHGQVNAVLDLVIDGEAVEVGDYGKWADYLEYDLRDGSGAGGDYAASLAAFPQVWTADHRLQGMATLEVRMSIPAPEDISEFWPKGSNTEFALIVETSLLFDPRTGLTEYSDNPALALRDHLTHADGWNIPDGWIDDDSVGRFADRCARPITLKNGSVEPWARIGGYYTLDEECKNTTERMLQTCDGHVFMTPDGKIGLMGGAWSEPDVTLDDDDIITIDLEDGRDPFEEYNIQKGLYVDPANQFKETEVAEWTDTTALATQPARTTEFEVDMCPSGPQLQRLMKIRRMRDRREWVGTIRTKLSGIKARFPRGDGAHIIRVVWSEMDIDGPFEVLSWQLDPQTMQCVIEIGSVENAWAWDASEQTDPPTMASDLIIPSQAPNIPTGLAVQQQVVIITGQTAHIRESDTAVRLVAFINEPSRPSLRPIFRYREKDAGRRWEAMDVPPDANFGTSPVVSDNKTYEVQVRYARQGAKPASDAGTTLLSLDDRRYWTPTVDITTLANPDQPSAPTGFTHTLDGQQVTLTWTSEASRTRIFRSPTDDIGNASSMATISGIAGAPSELVDEPGPGDWWYWAVALNPSYVASLATDPEAVTIT